MPTPVDQVLDDQVLQRYVQGKSGNEETKRMPVNTNPGRWEWFACYRITDRRASNQTNLDHDTILHVCSRVSRMVTWGGGWMTLSSIQ